MAKAFVFSLDAIFAVIILMIFLTAFVFLSAQAEEDPYTSLILKKQANDALIVLDKGGNLSTLNSTLISDSLNNLLSSSLDWNMEIDYYNYSGGFVHEGNLSLGNSTQNIEIYAHAQREFLVFESGTIKNYGTARLTLWVD